MYIWGGELSDGFSKPPCLALVGSSWNSTTLLVPSAVSTIVKSASETHGFQEIFKIDVCQGYAGHWSCQVCLGTRTPVRLPECMTELYLAVFLSPAEAEASLFEFAARENNSWIVFLTKVSVQESLHDSEWLWLVLWLEFRQDFAGWSSLFLAAHHFRHTVINIFVVLAVFLLAADSFISVISSCDITEKRELSCSGSLLLSFCKRCCSCSSSCMFCVYNVAVPGTLEDVNVFLLVTGDRVVPEYSGKLANKLSLDCSNRHGGAR